MIFQIIAEKGPFIKYNIGYPFYEISTYGITIYRKSDNKNMGRRFKLRVITKDDDGNPLNEVDYIYDTVDNYYYVIDEIGGRHELRELYPEFSTRL